MPVMEGDNDHEGERDGRGECEGNKAVEEGKVWTGCLLVWRWGRFRFGADGITHT
jgi:hypothetical protein